MSRYYALALLSCNHLQPILVMSYLANNDKTLYITLH